MNAHPRDVAMPSQQTYFVIFAALLGLLVVTVAVAFAHLEHPWNTVIALVIATIKAALVVLYFMHVRYQRPPIWVTASAGLLWLFILLGLTFSDYMTRRFDQHGPPVERQISMQDRSAHQNGDANVVDVARAGP